MLMLKKSFYFLIILSLTFFSCKTSTENSFRIASLDSMITPKKIPITELARNCKSYQGQYIETTGTFYYAFEDVSINTSKHPLTGERAGFWLDMNHELNISSELLRKMDGKRVTIKGKIDTADKGHLGMYLASITSIYFWQQ